MWECNSLFIVVTRPLLPVNRTAGIFPKKALQFIKSLMTDNDKLELELELEVELELDLLI